MTWRLATGLVMLALPFAVGVYDLIAYEIGGDEATISKTCLNIEARTVAFAMALAWLGGMAAGHLFLPQTVPPK